jgi:hypothetical protein
MQQDYYLGRSLTFQIRFPRFPFTHPTLGLSLREMIHEFKYQTLVLFKCLLLQPKVSAEVTYHVCEDFS